MMQRDDFGFLFINLNSIAELALDSSNLQDLSPGGDQQPVVSGARPDALIPDSLDELDMDALDGMAFFGDDDLPEDLSEYAHSGKQPVANDGPGPAPFDIDTYMDNANGMLPELAARIDRVFATVDQPRIMALLAALPDELVPLTRRLRGSELELWLDLYRANHAALSELVVVLRRSDPL